MLFPKKDLSSLFFPDSQEKKNLAVSLSSLFPITSEPSSTGWYVKCEWLLSQGDMTLADNLERQRQEERYFLTSTVGLIQNSRLSSRSLSP